MATTDNELEARVFEQVREKIAKNQIILPSLPQIAIKVREFSQQDGAKIEALSQVIAGDAAISARLLKVANSAYNRASSPITTVKGAVVRLGLDLVKILVTQLSTLQMMNTNGRESMDGLVKDGLNIGAIAAALAEQHPHLDSETAMLAGLVHDIGRLPLLDGLEQIPETQGKPDIQGVMADRLHGMVGAMLLVEWGFPKDLVTVAAEHERLERPGGKLADYVDIVITAMVIHYLTTGRQPLLRGLSPMALPAVLKTLPDRKIPAEEIKRRKAYVETLLS